MYSEQPGMLSYTVWKACRQDVANKTVTIKANHTGCFTVLGLDLLSQPAPARVVSSLCMLAAGLPPGAAGLPVDVLSHLRWRPTPAPSCWEQSRGKPRAEHPQKHPVLPRCP